MESESGLTTEDAQFAICTGTYGNKEWSATEKQTACQRYEQLSGNKPIQDGVPTYILTGTIFFILLATALFAYALYKKKRTSNTKNNK